MNGTIYEEIKKNGVSKKKDKLKLFVALFLSNLLVAALCLTFGPNDHADPLKKIIHQTLHPHYKMMVIPLSLMIDRDPNTLETPVTLMNKSKKILIPKAYLHQALTNSNKDQDGLPLFKIEIPEDEVPKLIDVASEVVIAIPEIQLPTEIKKLINKRVSKYEINL